MDEIPWTHPLLDKREEWTASFKKATQESPDRRATVDAAVCNLVAEQQMISSHRRLACDSSPLSDFLSLLAVLLPLMFLIYWMFVRRIHYPQRNTPTNQKTFKGSRPGFRTAL